MAKDLPLTSQSLTHSRHSLDAATKWQPSLRAHCLLGDGLDDSCDPLGLHSEPEQLGWNVHEKQDPTKHERDADNAAGLRDSAGSAVAAFVVVHREGGLLEEDAAVVQQHVASRICHGHHTTKADQDRRTPGTKPRHTPAPFVREDRPHKIAEEDNVCTPSKVMAPDTSPLRLKDTAASTKCSHHQRRPTSGTKETRDSHEHSGERAYGAGSRSSHRTGNRSPGSN